MEDLKWFKAGAIEPTRQFKVINQLIVDSKRMLRTHTCNDIDIHNIGTSVTLAGWVHSRRDHGGIIFIDLRDRYGITQLRFDPKSNKKVWEQANELRCEWVIKAKGSVVKRPDDMINKKLNSGEIEIDADELEVLSRAKTPPFELEEEKISEIREELRMEYRYIDLRRRSSVETLIKRHEFISFLRSYLNEKEFIEIETPVLTKSTPEGARDFLVPSRLQAGKFYALPQSPQQYKQLLMLSGVDKYYQIAKCFRDEDTRGDRQPEFTQLDLEMSFVEQDDILKLTEDIFTKAIESVFPDKKFLAKPWLRLNYDEVMLKYGVDKPDLRFNMEIKDLTSLVKGCGFKVFADAVERGNVVRALCAPKSALKLSRSQIDELTEYVKKFGAKGLAYMIIEKDGLRSPIVKFLGNELAKKIVREMEAKEGDIIFFGADTKEIVCESLGNLRIKLGQKLNLIDENLIALAFIVGFPLFEETLENGHYMPSHHMFTAPKDEDLELLDADPGKARSHQYDIVANGFEVGGGSIRIHNRKTQEKIFDLIGFNERRKKQFKHFLRAFEYGAPPHGGIAPGIDRMLMVLMNKSSIRDVMAFPKTGDGRDLMIGTPSEVEKEQLDELHLKIK
ncbi:MAG: aspartate--tRNA ligase [Patescibacteria group bacterium]|nr:aspartate--tRNA ligase [Patescibacteria group bacterium]